VPAFTQLRWPNLRYGLKHAYILQDLVAWNPAIWDRYHLTSEEEGFVKRNVDFSQIGFSAVFVIHDNGMDWGLATQVITEVLTSQGGVLGTYKARQGGADAEVPLILTNPDVIWGSDYPLPRLGMGAFRLALEAVYKVSHTMRMNFKPCADGRRRRARTCRTRNSGNHTRRRMPLRSRCYDGTSSRRESLQTRRLTCTWWAITRSRILRVRTHMGGTRYWSRRGCIEEGSPLMSRRLCMTMWRRGFCGPLSGS